MISKLIYSVSEIFSQEILESGKQFIIPAYQRGYKWKPESVTRLLDDVNRFDDYGDEEKFYCLQNITLVKNNCGFNVVDGQQRLTTIMVILSCLGDSSLFKGKISYQVRPETEKFINQYLSCSDSSAKLDSYENWSSFVSSNEGYDFQDIYYLFSAYKAIMCWIQENINFESSYSSFKQKFITRTKLIINLIRNTAEQELFRNLNGGKVELDGADLVRALIITNVAREEFGDEIDTTKKIVQLNESRTRIGIQIDSIMSWWKVPDHFNYYLPVFKNFASSDEMDFNHNEYPIDGLYKIFAIINGKTSMDLDLFEHKASSIWPEIQTLQRTLEDWYDDNEIYHLLMYICLYKGKNVASNFIQFMSEWNKKGMCRDSFKELLKKEVNSLISSMPQKVLLDGETKETEKLAYEEQCSKEDWYSDNHVISVMVLLDIIKILAPNSTCARLAPQYFKPYYEDKEHIFPQLPIGGKINQKTIESQQKVIDEYLSMSEDAIRKTTGNPSFRISVDKPDWTDNLAVETYRDTINGIIQSAIPINSLGNICLLNESVNRGYGNDFFTEKRVSLFKSARNGEYIRPHVFDAFDKNWNGEETELHLDTMKSWSKEDIVNRRIEIANQIKNFLSNE